jgi:hypothetical protein
MLIGFGFGFAQHPLLQAYEWNGSRMTLQGFGWCLII